MNWADIYFHLRKTAPFHQLEEGELSQLASLLLPKKWSADTVLLEEGEYPFHMYVVVEGSVRTSKGEPLPAIFGPTSLLLGSPLPTTLKSGPEPVTCLLLPKRHFFSFINQVPVIFLNYIRQSSTGDLQI